MADTIDFIEQLISEVRMYPWLYEVHRPDYKDTEKKRSTWQSISHDLGIPAEECIKKWTDLRNRFSKEERLLKKKRNEGTNDMVGSTWPLMPLMSFLKGHIRTKRTFKRTEPVYNIQIASVTTLQDIAANSETLSSMCESQQSDFINGEEIAEHSQRCLEATLDSISSTYSPSELSNHNTPTTDKSNQQKTLTLFSEKSDQKPLTTLGHTLHEKIRNCETEAKSEHQIDEHYHFGMVVASQLRAMAPEQCKRARVRILSVINEEEGI